MWALYLIIIVACILGLGINIAIRKGVRKTIDAARNVKADISNERHAGERKYLRDLYPDFQPNLKKGEAAPEQHSSKHTSIQETATAALHEANQAKDKAISHIKQSISQKTAQQTQQRASRQTRERTSQTVPQNPPRRTFINPFQENACCICNGRLDAGYAVLFRMENGLEARIDQGCHAAIYDITSSNDPQILCGAYEYLSDRRQYVDPSVGAYLDSYLQYASDLLGYSNTQQDRQRTTRLARSTSASRRNSRSKGNSKRILLIFIVVIVLIAAILAGVHFLRPNSGKGWSDAYRQFILEGGYRASTQPSFYYTGNPEDEITFTIYDINNNGAPELIAFCGDRSDVAVYYVFTYHDSKFYYLGNIPYSGMGLCHYSNRSYSGLFTEIFNYDNLDTYYYTFPARPNPIQQEMVKTRTYNYLDGSETVNKMTTNNSLFKLTTNSTATYLIEYTYDDIVYMGWEAFVRACGYKIN